MKYKYLIPCLLLFLGMTVNSIGQVDLSSLSAGKLKKLGTTALYNGDYYSASRYLEAYCKEKEDDYKIMFSLAESYRLSRNYAAAEVWYDKAYKANPQKNAKALFYYATMIKTSHVIAKLKDTLSHSKKNMLELLILVYILL